MPRKQDVHPSKFFRAASVPDGWTLTAEVEVARLERMGNGHDEQTKLVVYFKRQKSGLVCGPVLWDQFVEITGSDEANDWKGHKVELYRDRTQFQGKTVPCIRVRKPGTASKKSKAAPSKNMDDDMNDSVEF